MIAISTRGRRDQGLSEGETAGRPVRAAGAIGGRGHWVHGWSVALAGAGIRTGQAGGSCDEEGWALEEKAVRIPDLYATICTALGADPREEFVVGNRPVPRVESSGRPVVGLLHERGA